MPEVGLAKPVTRASGGGAWRDQAVVGIGLPRWVFAGVSVRGGAPGGGLDKNLPVAPKIAAAAA